MMNAEQLIQDLIRDEGLKTDLYQDAIGKWTIGVGRNLSDRGVSKGEAMFMLTNDIEIVMAELDARMLWWRGMPADVQRALANMAFNLGVPRLLKFEMMLAALKVGDYETAAEEALDSLWADQSDGKVDGIDGARARRIADLMRHA